MKVLLKNIKSLVNVEDQARLLVKGKAMDDVKCIDNAWLLVDGERIADFGSMDTMDDNATIQSCDELLEMDMTGHHVFPSFCDSHTHLVYAGSREVEYVDKIKGLSYEEIAKRGGGILNSAKLLHNTSEDELYEQSMRRIREIISQGTGAVEIKSGYGLNPEDELKMLRVIKRIKDTSPIEVVATFLGAHAVPAEYKGRQTEYVDMVINEMIPQVAAEELADYIDVFCDKGFFTVEDTDRILMAGMKYGMKPKIHANELAKSGGIQVGVKYAALSVDHIEYTEKEEMDVLMDSDTMPTVLPGAAFFLNMPFAPAREMIDYGLPVAFASDYNPGSSPTGNMKLMNSFACVNYRLTPDEALMATTINTAYAMGLSEDFGSIAKGKYANLFSCPDIPSRHFLPYAYGSDLIGMVMLKGEVLS
ncbi:MAG: imidazolonepropionase [Bacteroidales bacterium]|jgi:imidazolonepropionase|nr:imidazolonepropionase [Bacteroidales bacterium]